MVKAAETNLFADADSNRTHMQELVLYVCEWGNSDYILVSEICGVDRVSKFFNAVL